MTLYRHGAFWEKVDGDQTWRTLVEDRYGALVWPLRAGTDSRFQVKAFAGDVEIYLTKDVPRDQAMGHGLTWIKAYKATGPASPETVLTELFERNRTWCRTRLAAFDLLFIRERSKYAWLDGALIDTSPQREPQVQLSFFADVRRLFDDLPDEVRIELTETNPTIHPFLYPEELPPGPDPDDGGSFSFSPINLTRSNIARVPEDVHQDWLALVYEAATALRDRAGTISGKVPGSLASLHGDADEQARNRKLGTQICAKLHERFPHRLTKEP